MRLVFLHGPPASGKYTIATGLQDEAGLLNLHNHLTIDVSKALFDFGTPEFWELTHELRRAALRAKAGDPAAEVVVTNCYSYPEDQANVEALERIVSEGGGEFLPVFLQCGIQELRRRVGAQSRQDMRKLTSVEGLEGFLEKWNIVPYDHPSCITIHTEGRDPVECVREVILRLRLGDSGRGDQAPA